MSFLHFRSAARALCLPHLHVAKAQWTILGLPPLDLPEADDFADEATDALLTLMAALLAALLADLLAGLLADLLADLIADLIALGL